MVDIFTGHYIPETDLSNVIQIYSTERAFAALINNGSGFIFGEM